MQTDVGKDNRIEKRCQIVTLNHSGINQQTIAWFAQCHRTTVHRWISRSQKDDHLHDKSRHGREPIYSEEIQLKTTAFYCQVSPLPGCNGWSLRWAEKYLKGHKEILGCSISRSTIQRFLKMHSLRPHLHKYYLAITDPDFFQKMEPVISLYLNPPEYLFCFDECTGLQAKSQAAPVLPVSPDKPRYEEFEYSRNGTTDLMAFLNPKTGEVFGKCTPNHNTQTLIGVFNEHVNTLPSNAKLHYVMDNLSPHFNDEFCKTVAQLSGQTYHPLKTGIERRNWLQNDDKRIVIHFVPFHGSWLNMIEIWFGILSKKCLKHQSFQSLPELITAIEEFIETWNNSFCHPFTWRYTGEGLHEKVISRFNKLLYIESDQIDIKYLTKQLLLMTNIVKSYFKKVQSKMWEQLHGLIVDKTNFINGIIENATKERQVVKAQQAFDLFKSCMAQQQLIL